MPDGIALSNDCIRCQADKTGHNASLSPTFEREVRAANLCFVRVVGTLQMLFRVSVWQGDNVLKFFGRNNEKGIIIILFDWYANEVK
jgi:hypothetical protein